VPMFIICQLIGLALALCTISLLFPKLKQN